MMQLFLLLLLCWLTSATVSDLQQSTDAAFPPRYTLLAESKKKEQHLDRQQQQESPNEQQQPWRRFAYSNPGSHPISWPASSPAALLAPGLMLLGINLGALLYMLLGLLGLAPPQRFVPFHHQDIYRNDRQSLGGGKDLDMYL